MSSLTDKLMVSLIKQSSASFKKQHAELAIVDENFPINLDSDIQFDAKFFSRVDEETINKLQEILALNFAAIDKLNYSIIRTIPMQINSTADAIQARNTYTQNWFKKLILSPLGKQRLAQNLIDRSKVYVGDGVPRIWTLLAKGGEDAFIATMFTAEDL